MFRCFFGLALADSQEDLILRRKKLSRQLTALQHAVRAASTFV